MVGHVLTMLRPKSGERGPRKKLSFREPEIMGCQTQLRLDEVPTGSVEDLLLEVRATPLPSDNGNAKRFAHSTSIGLLMCQASDKLRDHCIICRVYLRIQTELFYKLLLLRPVYPPPVKFLVSWMG